MVPDLSQPIEPTKIRRKRKLEHIAESPEPGEIIKPKHPGGHPRTFFWKNHTQGAEKLFAQGGSIKEVAVFEFHITPEHLCRLQKKDSELNQFILRGVSLSEAWWQKQGRLNLKERKFNSHLYMLNMMNRFDWNMKNKNKNEDIVKAKVEIPGLDDIVNNLLEKSA